MVRDYLPHTHKQGSLARDGEHLVAIRGSGRDTTREGTGERRGIGKKRSVQINEWWGEWLLCLFCKLQSFSSIFQLKPKMIYLLLTKETLVTCNASIDSCYIYIYMYLLKGNHHSL